MGFLRRDGGGGRNKGALEMLERCHRRIEDELGRLAALARAHGAGRTDFDALRDVAAFFERTGTRHIADEEESLFPRLAGQPGTGALLDRMVLEHRELDRLHTELMQVAEEHVSDPARLAALADELAAAYRQHIELEDRDLMPRVRSLLAAETLDEIAAEMQARRGR